MYQEGIDQDWGGTQTDNEDSDLYVFRSNKESSFSEGWFGREWSNQGDDVKGHSARGMDWIGRGVEESLEA